MLALAPLLLATVAPPSSGAPAVVAAVQEPDLEDLHARLRAATDRAAYLEHDAYQAAKTLADLRSADAMRLRLALFDPKWDTYRGVYLREWFYTGMRRAQSVEETDLLAEAAAERRNSEWMRVLCLRALAECDAPVRQELLLDRALRRSEGTVQRAWQDALGRCAAERRLRDEDGAVVAAVGPVRAALREAGAPYLGHRHLSAWHDEDLELIAEAAAEADDPGDRAQCTRMLAARAREMPGASAAFVRAAALAFDDDAVGPRAATCDAAAEHRVAAVVPVLISALEEEVDDGPSRWISDLGHALRAVTGLPFGDAPGRWRDWWRDAGEEWLAAAAEGDAGPAPERGESDTVARFFGLAVDSVRVAILVDGSGSMSASTLGEISCVEAAAREVQGFLEKAPKGARFNVMVVESEPVLAFDRMQRVSRSTREDAADFLRRREYRSTSALYDALERAMVDPEVDTVLLISDGGSSAGRHQHDEHLLESVRPLYERTGVRIHAVHVTDGDRHADVMSGLAELTGGRMVRPSD